ncbi:Uncharacterised protein [uncultured archaeon]|nr:Uncharacterised protein [uncultured archaeon]
MKKGGNLPVIILISVVIILVLILIYGVYTGFKVKAEIKRLNSQIAQLSEDKNNLQKNYDLLIQDVAQIYKTCIKENACKGHYPGVSWYCNNVGNEVDNPSHTCVCDSSCNLNATQISY